ncbi:hypothetical protein AGRA3207_007548 [Actinomadura graeca]|uniref:Uncharacterized protein n=1 Tax=Actinomadura graeca TaxID=2750812 RepID=A0ABX8R615_9ACTN|nr:hypothetical protein [Actinomadura graeca]QXJ25976.1 hypothetical protein AGRA3207_007548 [Actinomadura graeca]
MRPRLVLHMCERGHCHAMHPLAVQVARERRWSWACQVPGCTGHLSPVEPLAKIPPDHRDDHCRQEQLALLAAAAVVVVWAWRKRR